MNREVYLVVLLCVACLACSCRQNASDSSQSAPVQTIKTPSGIEMIQIPAGEFSMGSSTSGKAEESPAHPVQVDAFLMDRTEITQEQFGKLMPDNPAPSHFKGTDRPVEQVSWAEAAIYCNSRSKAEGFTPCYDETTAKCNFAANGYRLPTEAEWEYACRAGSTGEYFFGADPQQLRRYAWFADNSEKKTQPVAQKQANAWGLYDLCGNVAEWCNEAYDPAYYAKSPKENPPGPDDGDRYVLRGGAWNSRPESCRSAARAGAVPGFQDACFARDAIGFRCVRRPAEGKTGQP